MEALHNKPFSSIRQFYNHKYPTDELGGQIRNITFLNLFDDLRNRRDIYKSIGVDDSIVRERLFDALADVFGVEYRYIYRLWFRS